MPAVYLIHWNEEEAEEKARALKAAGYKIQFHQVHQQKLREIRLSPPDAFVISLSRLPSHGREIAMALRQSKATGAVPIVFADGAPEKVEGVRKFFPDATYTDWSKIKSALKHAIANPPENPIKPKSVFDAYVGVPLIKKLGIKSGMHLALINSPQDFLTTVGNLPEDVKISTKLSGEFELIIWFVRSQKEYKSGLLKIKRALAEKSGIWIAWPKKTSGIESDLSEAVVRKIGLENGLVDYKICSIDNIWSGLKFKIR